MCVWFHSLSPCPASPSLTIDCDCSEKFSVTSCEFCNNENYEFKLIFPDLYCYLSQGILFAGHLVLRRPDLTEVLKFRPHKRHNQRGKETPKYTGHKTSSDTICSNHITPSSPYPSLGLPLSRGQSVGQLPFTFHIFYRQTRRPHFYEKA